MIKYAQKFLRTHSWFVAIFQAFLICFSLVFAWLLRFDYSLPDRRSLMLALGIVVPIRLTAIWRFGLLHGWWKYTGPSDVLDVLRAVSVGSIVFILTVHYLLGLHGFPRSVYVLEPVFTAGLLIGVRVFSRLVAESVRQDFFSARKIMLVGAGVAAQTVIHELKRPKSGYAVIGCLDDDPSKAGLKIGGVPVLGTVDDLSAISERYAPTEVLIAVPSASGKQMQRFVEACERAQVKFRTVPALRDVIHGKVAVSQFRNVRVEDLLGRDPVDIDLQSVKDGITNRVVMVTGAAGSIGSELCRQILEYAPAGLLCVDQNETGMFYLERELSLAYNNCPQNFVVADVGDSERMQKLFVEHRPEIIFHAAAYKHVPMMESNVGTAVRNNVFALLDLLQVAEENGCKGFVLISSDKAVNPTSTMGATKRLGELIISHRHSHKMRCVAVRFGNVLGSCGSVIPVLQEQLRTGKPLTITHPEMKRFFMTIREAVSLVLQAFAIGDQGDVLVLDMGTPVKIVELARTLIQLSGKKEDEIEIEFTGMRPGEKLFEELFYPEEVVRDTSCPKIKKARNVVCGWGELESQLDDLRAVLYVDGASPIRAKIKQIIPEYSYYSAEVCPFPDEGQELRKSAMGA
jgi:FlaA1/EpsC-like NDP-sugar epimerase